MKKIFGFFCCIRSTTTITASKVVVFEASDAIDNGVLSRMKAAVYADIIQSGGYGKIVTTISPMGWTIETRHYSNKTAPANQATRFKQAGQQLAVIMQSLPPDKKQRFFRLECIISQD